MAASHNDNIDALFARMLVGDADDEGAWQAVSSLRKIASREVFDGAAQWTRSSDPRRRSRGLDVIARIGSTFEHPSNAFPQEAYDVVTDAVRREQEEGPLHSGIFALGHIGDDRAIPLIASFHAHPSEAIRYAVAWALGKYANDPLSVPVLMRLMEDTDAEVRDWATFALGVLGEQDTEEIREGLARRLADEDENTREEAMVGLANRHDSRILPSLICGLQQPEIGFRTIQAAYTLLGFDADREEWSGEDYIRALQQRFPQTTPTAAPRP